MTDEVVTHAEVLRWLPAGIRRDLEMAMPPEQRGWFTADEVANLPSEWIPVQELSSSEVRYLRGRR